MKKGKSNHQEIILSSEKQRFQLDRMILFSDAVFAIAMTLMVIDLKIPQLSSHTTDTALVNALLELTPRFFAFLLSFFLIGLYWTIHHRLYGFVIRHTPALIWLNLFFLLGIVLLPFSTNFYSEYIITTLKTPLIVYCLNFAFIGLVSYLMHRYATNKKRGLTEGIPYPVVRYRAFRAQLIPIIFSLIIVVSFIDIRLAFFMPPLIPLIMYLLSKIYKRRHRKDFMS